MQAYATKNGVVSLTNKYPGFAVDVDFSDESENSDSDSDDDSTTMLLGLFTSQTMLSYGCENDFTYYFCEDYSSCYQYTSNTIQVNYPTFSASGYQANTNIYVDYDNFALESNKVVIADQCSTNGTSFYGGGAYGMLGMANNDVALTPTTFSIYVDQALDSGKLLFTEDSDYYVQDSSSIYLSADSNLHIHTFNYLDVGYITLYNTNTSVIFDLNAQYIGLPLALYKSVISTFNSDYSMDCPTTGFYTGVTCDYEGYLYDLPTITLYVQNQAISLPPSIYISGYGDGNSEVTSVTLNLQALDPNMTGSNYVTSTYKNYIILDYHVMSYYYTVFENYGSSSNSVTLYLADHSVDNRTDPTVYYIIGGCVGAMILLMICCCCCKAAGNRAQAQALNAAKTAYKPPVVNSVDDNAFSSQTTNNYGQTNYNQYAQQQFPQEQYPQQQFTGYNNQTYQFQGYQQPQAGFDNNGAQSGQYYI